MRPRYLDPATGSYVIQMLVAGLLGVIYSVRGFLFGSSAGAEDDEDDEDETGEERDPSGDDEDTGPGEPGEDEDPEDGAEKPTA